MAPFIRQLLARLACRYYGHQETRIVVYTTGAILARSCDRCGAASWNGSPL